jgi:hypothetical protein
MRGSTIATISTLLTSLNHKKNTTKFGVCCPPIILIDNPALLSVFEIGNSKDLTSPLGFEILNFLYTYGGCLLSEPVYACFIIYTPLIWDLELSACFVTLDCIQQL